FGQGFSDVTIVHEDLLDGGGDMVADGREGTNDRASGGGGGFRTSKLFTGDAAVRVFLEPTFSFKGFDGRLGDGDVTGELVPCGGVLGVGEVQQEGQRAFFDFRRQVVRQPQAGATDQIADIFDVLIAREEAGNCFETGGLT